MAGVIGRQTGQSIGSKMVEGFQSTSGSIFQKLGGAFQSIGAEAEAARGRFQSLVRTGYVLQGVIGPLIGGISALAVSLGTLVGIVGKATPAIAALANIFVALRVAMAVAKFGFGDIASAVKAATDPTKAMGKSIEELREEFQQLMFDAEQATMSEARAAINLEDALNNLRRVQDLPPNSRARREAQLAYEEADLAFRRAKDRAADLNEEVNKGFDEFAKNSQNASGNDPFAGLNDAQKEFAKKLVELQPLIDELELAVSEALLTPLWGAVEVLRDNLFPLLRTRLPQVAGRVGKAMENIAIDLTTPENLQKMDNILLEMQPNLDLLGGLFGNILDIILSILDATGPLVNDFLTWAVEKTQQWSDTLTRMNADGSLDKFFEEAGAAAGDLGEIIGNVFLGIGNLIGLTTGPGSAGEDMLDWMKSGTETFANMFSEDPEAGKQFFKDAFANARDVMSSIGALLGEILGLADNPNIGETFRILEEGAPAVGDMLGKMIDAGPSFAELVKTITEIANKLTDSEQLSAFFDTLAEGARRFNEFLDTPAAKNVLDNLGPIFATLSALGVLFDLIKFAFLTIVGYGLFISKIFKPFMKDIGGLKGIAGKIGAAFRVITGPVGLIVTAIIFLISKAVEFYNTIEGFRQMVDNVFGVISDSFGELGAEIGRTFDLLFGGEGGGGLFSVLDPIIQVILEVLIPALGFVTTTFIDMVTLVLSWVNNLIEGVIPGFTEIVDGIMLLFSDFPAGIEKIFGGIGTLLGGIVQFIVNSIIDVINFGIKAINNLIGIATGSDFAKWLGDILGVDMQSFQFDLIPHVDMLSGGPTPGDMQAAGGADRALVNRFNNSAAYTNFNNQRQAAMNASSMSPSAMDAASGNISITVNPSPGMNERELGKIVGQEIARQTGKGILN